MTNTMPPAPAGWYPDQDGSQRYWDGQRWLDIPAPPSSPASASAQTPGRSWYRRPWLWVAVTVAALVALGGAAAVATVSLQAQAASEAAAASQEALEEQAAEEAAADAAASRAAEQAAEDERLESVREVAAREAAIREVESSVSEMAGEHDSEGFIDGPVISTMCTPVDGYALDNLAQPSAVLECFVATEDLGDGRMRGYDYNATVNWETYQYTYGRGAP